MNIKLGYGNSFQNVEIPQKNILDILHANELHHEHVGVNAIKHAIENPIGDYRLKLKNLIIKI